MEWKPDCSGLVFSQAVGLGNFLVEWKRSQGVLEGDSPARLGNFLVEWKHPGKQPVRPFALALETS